MLFGLSLRSAFFFPKLPRPPRDVFMQRLDWIIPASRHTDARRFSMAALILPEGIIDFFLCRNHGISGMPTAGDGVAAVFGRKEDSAAVAQMI